jgi:hypothetical protein
VAIPYTRTKPPQNCNGLTTDAPLGLLALVNRGRQESGKPKVLDRMMTEVRFTTIVAANLVAGAHS